MLPSCRRMLRLLQHFAPSSHPHKQHPHTIAAPAAPTTTMWRHRTPAAAPAAAHDSSSASDADALLAPFQSPTLVSWQQQLQQQASQPRHGAIGPIAVIPTSTSPPSRYIKYGNPIADVLESCAEQLARAAAPHSTASTAASLEFDPLAGTPLAHPTRPSTADTTEQPDQFLQAGVDAGGHNQQPKQAPPGSGSASAARAAPAGAAEAGGMSAGGSAASLGFPFNLAVWGGPLEGIAHLQGQFPQLCSGTQPGEVAGGQGMSAGAAQVRPRCPQPQRYACAVCHTAVQRTWYCTHPAGVHLVYSSGTAVLLPPCPPCQTFSQTD